MTHEETIFAEALGKGIERDAYLNEACAGDDKLRRGVDALLLAHERAAGILESPAVGLDDTSDIPSSVHSVGSTIGPYKLLEQIGGGGMGVVFMAEQVRPVRRKVALKIIKPGMDSGQVIARFEAERQALTMMDHPNIARVLDAGATDAGRPYFVMELVKGVPITDYCDQARLDTRQRLDLFVQVCNAVQHAHQKGVIHRDLKPTNVLVTLHDDKPVPKVIDFGIAKATGQQLTERTLFTNYAQMLGTPLYMSPEQAQLSGLDVDTRSDIYSLGVLLYELLTGTTPFDKQRLREAAYDEMRRIIREEEPPKPSTRISSLSDRIASISAQRHTEPKKLGQLVRGELDWIVMKALEKDRTRRYDTANGLARDVERHLHDEAVQACPPSAAYRARKFARRNKVVLTTAAALAAVLLAATGVSTWQAVRATRAEGRADGQRQVADEQRVIADRQRGLADENRRQAELALADTLPHNGWAAVERGEAGEAVLWFEYAARLSAAAGDADRLFANRVRARTAEWAAVTPVAALPHEAEHLESLAFDPGGRYLLTRSLRPDSPRGDGVCTLWDLSVEKALPLPFVGAPGAVTAAAWSPDGKTLALGGGSGEVWLCDFPGLTRRHLLTVRPGEAVRDVAFSADGLRLAAAAGGIARAWDVAAGGAPAPLTPELGHPQPVAFVSFSPDDGRLLTAAWDGTARVFAVEGDDNDVQGAGQVVAAAPHVLRPYGPGSRPVAPRLVPVGGRLQLLTCGPRSLDWRKVEDGQVVRTFPAEEGVQWLDVGPAGRGLLLGTGMRVVMLGVADGKLLADLPQPAPTVFGAFSPMGRTLVACPAGRGPTVWLAARGGRRLAGLGQVTGGADCAAFSPAAPCVATAEPGGLVRVWALPADRPAHRLLPVDGTATLAAFSRDGRHVLATGAAYNHESDGYRPDLYSVRLYEVASGEPAGPPLQPGGIVTSAALSPDGGRVATLSRREKREELQLWDARSGRPLPGAAWPLKLPAVGLDVAWRPDGSAVGVLCGGDGEGGGVLLVGAADGNVLRQWKPARPEQPAPTSFGRIVFARDGRTAFTWGTAAAQAWDVDTGAHRFALAHEARMGALRLSPDGRHVAAASADERVRVWDAQTGRRLAELRVPGTAHVVRFSPDGSELLTGGGDGVARTWDWRAQQMAAATEAQLGQVFAVAYTPNGRWILTADREGKTRAWDRKSGRPVTPSFDLGMYALSIEVSPDGEYAVVGGQTTSRKMIVLSLADLLPDGSRGADPGASAASVAAASGWGELLSGRRIALGGTANLATADWLANWRQYEDRVGPRAVRATWHAPDSGASWDAYGRWVARSAADGETLAVRSGVGRLVEAGHARWSDWRDRGRAYAALGEWPAAERDLAQAVQVRPDERDLWIEHGDALIALGRWDAAAEEYGKAIESQSSQGSDGPLGGPTWVRGNWWVVGPYPQGLATPFAPEIHAVLSPTSQPAATQPSTRSATTAPAMVAIGAWLDTSRGLDREPLRWKLVRHRDPWVDFTTSFTGTFITGYAQTFIYSLREQMVGLSVGADDQVRLWLNGELVNEQRAGGRRSALRGQGRRLVQLRAGWNVLLAKVVTIEDRHELYAALSADPSDLAVAGVDDLLKRATEHARAGRYPEAAEPMAAALEMSPGLDSMYWMQQGVLLADAGDAEGHRRHCRAMLDRYANVISPHSASRLARTWAMLPGTAATASAADVEAVLKLADRGLEDASPDFVSWMECNKGMALYRAGRLQEAVAWLAKARGRSGSRADSVGATATLYLAMAHHGLNQPNEARAMLEAGLEGAAVVAADEAFRTGQYWHDWVITTRLAPREAGRVVGGMDEAGVAAAMAGPRERAAEVAGLLRDADAAGRGGQYRRAADLYAQALRLDPSADSMHWILCALALAQVNDGPAYLRHCEVMRERFADAPPLYDVERAVRSGTLLPRTGADAARLLTMADRCVQAAPADPWCIQTKGFALYRAGRFVEAVEWLSKAGNQDMFRPRDSVQGGAIWLYLAMAYQQSGQHDKARESLDEGLRRADVAAAQPGAHLWHTVLTAQAVRAEAERVVGGPSAGTVVRPGLAGAGAVAQRGQVYARFGKFPEALAHFVKAAELDPDSPVYRYEVACLLAYLGDGAAYRTARSRILERYGDSEDFLVNEWLSKACLLLPGEGDDWEAPMRLVDRGLAQKPEFVWMHLSKAIADYRAGRFAASAARLEQWRPDLPHACAQPTAAFWLAMAYHRLGRLADADAIYAEALARMEELPAAGEADLGNSFREWLMCHVARREAEATLGRGPATRPTTQPTSQPVLASRTFLSRPLAVPGTIQAEDFDVGANGLAFRELGGHFAGMDNGRYRLVPVNVNTCASDGGGHDIGGIWAGEWLAYTVDVAESGSYDIDLRVSTLAGGGTLHLESGGKDLTGPIEMPNTGNWIKWTTVTKKAVHLAKGPRVLRVVFDTAPAESGHVCNLNWVRFTKSSAAVEPGQTGTRDR